MRIDDESSSASSIYVGGLPFSCSETELRRVFDLYGSILSVKINNDRMGGKCYGFITFANPRSAADAIEEMNGRTIGGRRVRVNGVMRRGVGGRDNHGRDNFRQNERNLDRGGGREREREGEYDNDRSRDHSREHDGERERLSDHTRDRDRSREHDGEREIFSDHTRDRDNSRDHFQGRERDISREVEEREWGHDRSSRDQAWEEDDNLYAGQDKQLDRVDDHDRNDKYHAVKRRRSSGSYDHQSREFSSEPSGYHERVEEQLDTLIKRREELQTEKFDMEERLDEKKRLITEMRKRSLKLEDALTSSKKLCSKRQTQLTQLYKCSQKVKEYHERLKSSEEGLQDLVNSVSTVINAGDADGATDILLTNA